MSGISELEVEKEASNGSDGEFDMPATYLARHQAEAVAAMQQRRRGELRDEPQDMMENVSQESGGDSDNSNDEDDVNSVGALGRHSGRATPEGSKRVGCIAPVCRCPELPLFTGVGLHEPGRINHTCKICTGPFHGLCGKDYTVTSPL